MPLCGKTLSGFEATQKRHETPSRQAAHQPESSLIKVNQTSPLLRQPPSVKTIFFQTKPNEMNRKKNTTLKRTACCDVSLRKTARQRMDLSRLYSWLNCVQVVAKSMSSWLMHPSSTTAANQAQSSLIKVNPANDAHESCHQPAAFHDIFHPLLPFIFLGFGGCYGAIFPQAGGHR